MNVAPFAPFALCVAAVAGNPGDAFELVVATPDGPRRVVIEVFVDGEAPSARWAKFLDGYFAASDRDGDGRLSAAELGRLVPLPVPGDHPFPKAEEVDADGRISKAELTEWLNRAGLRGVVVGEHAPLAASAERHSAFSRALDRNSDGRADAVEIADAPDLLRRADLDESGTVDLDELAALAGAAPADSAAIEPVLASGPGPGTGPVTRLTLNVSMRGGAAALTREDDGNGSQKDESRSAIVIGDAKLSATVQTATPPRVASLDFVRAHVRSIAGPGGAVEVAAVRDDPISKPAAAHLAAFDSDGDGRLTPTELDAGIEMAKAAIRAAVRIAVVDGGRNLFAAADSDGDGRLSRRELRHPLLPKPQAGEKSPATKSLPGSASLIISFGLEPTSPTSMVEEGVRDGQERAASAPRWFAACDRDGDGRVTAHEFVGPPEAFARLDRDGDGEVVPADIVE